MGSKSWVARPSGVMALFARAYDGCARRLTHDYVGSMGTLAAGEAIVHGSPSNRGHVRGWLGLHHPLRQAGGRPARAADAERAGEREEADARGAMEAGARNGANDERCSNLSTARSQAPAEGSAMTRRRAL